MVVNKSHDYDLDVKNCASVFFDKAYEIFSESIERFYEYGFIFRESCFLTNSCEFVLK